MVLLPRISQGSHRSGYGPFRPNKRGHRSRRGYSRGDCHPSCPPLIRGAFCTPQKPGENPRHSPSPRQAFTHCGGFAPGASRRTSALVSVPIWGLPLSRPLPVLGLTGRYPANYLMGRRPPLGRDWEGLSQSLSEMGEFHTPFPMEDYPQFPEVILLPRESCRRVTQPCGGIPYPVSLASHGLVGGG